MDDEGYGAVTPLEEEWRRTLAATEQLFQDGVYHKWFPAEPRWDTTIRGGDEYLAVVEKAMASYQRGRTHEEGLRMAANRLFREGRYHIWWPRTIQSWEGDPVSREAFISVVERMVAAYHREPLIGPQQRPDMGPHP